MKIQKYIILCIMTLLILVGCAENTQTENDVTEETGIDLYGTYDENDLMVVTLEKEYGETIAEIPQIEGLLNKEVEDKINKDIYQLVTQSCEEIPEINFVDYSLNANFANVLSLSVYLGSDDVSEQIYLNYNLVDGEKLRFEELFCENTDTLEIIREAFYESLILTHMSGESSENEFYKVVKSFYGNDDKHFVFTPSKVYLYQNEYTASVKMENIAEKIAIYSRYLTEESLYEKNNIGKKDIMTCVTIPDKVFDLIDFGYLHENCWYDISILQEYIGESFSKEYLAQYMIFKKDRYDEFYAMIEQYGQKALEHTDKFYIILSKPSFYIEVDSEWRGEEWIEEYSENVVVNEHFTVYEMPKELYENSYKEKLIEAYRYDYLALAGGIYLEATEENVEVLDRYQEKTYNYMTGEELD